jgi:ATP-binding cassette subfamily B protein
MKVPPRLRQNFLFLLTYARPYKRDFFWGILFVLLSTGAILLMGRVIQELLQQLKGSSHAALEMTTLKALALIVIVSGALLGRILFFGILGEKLIKDVKDAVFKKLMHLDITFFESRKAGDLMALILSDAYVVHSVFIGNMSAILRNLIMLGGSVLLMLTIQPALLICLSFLVLSLLLPLRFFGRKISSCSKEARQQAGLVSAHTEEAITGIRLLHAYNATVSSEEAFALKTQAQHAAIKKRVYFFGLNTCLTSLLLFGGLVSILFVAYQQGLILLDGQLGAFAYYSVVAAYALSDLLETSGQMYGSSASADRLRELMETTPHVIDPPNPLTLPAIQGHICFQDFSFAYPSTPTRPLFQNFSLAIQPGERIALVGPSGAGKSTLFSLLLRFYDPTQGSITLDGLHLSCISLESLRNAISYLPQDATIFSGTVAENIRMNNTLASLDGVKRAAEQAHALEFIQKLPQGFETYVGEKGIRLSGGQKQRIALARAILKNAPILLLDEPTSALDAESERLIQEALHPFLKGRTSLIIAHRLSTIMHCDRILVLDQGRLIAQGTHAQLLETCQLYAHYATLQLYAPEAIHASSLAKEQNVR